MSEFKPNRETLVLDMDGVITDTIGRVCDIAHDEDGLYICHADVEDYWFKGMIQPPSYLLDIMRREGFYLDLLPITGAMRAIRRLRHELNDNVVICTAPLNNAPTCEEEKRDWIARHFDQDFADRTMVVKDKDHVQGKVLVEDNPHVDDKPHEWEHLVLFTQRWNRHRTDVPHMNGWGDIDTITELMK